jgi:tetratricopeptide (TPR) repeat protein
MQQAQHSAHLAQRLQAEERRSDELAQQLQAEVQRSTGTRASVTLETFEALTQRGHVYLQQGDIAKARDAYQAALDKLALPLNQMAWLADQQGDYAKAQPLARLAVQLHADEPDYLDTLATILCHLGQQTEALQVLEMAAALQPQPFSEKLARFQQGLCQ